ncbi:MAG: Y-family DNA polymerase [Synergistaceae bacterium]|nr:Y-family DNA polymerase [Synergistaceae bacterium]
MGHSGSGLRKTRELLALCDCNNFFVSCERLFRPDLEGRPVVVLSSNDGIVIARSNEVKALGVKMGEPFFRVRPLLEQHGTAVFSSNFQLYEEVSSRVMAVLGRFTPSMEVYSIDEAFLELPPSGMDDPFCWGAALRGTVLRETGIPLSVGIAPTKTLAKLGAERAKKDRMKEGVRTLLPGENLDDFLSAFPVDDVWGIGRRWGDALKKRGITTVLRLRDAKDDWVEKRMGVRGLRTVWELRGIRCIPIEEAEKPQKSIQSSRTFAVPLREFSPLAEAVTEFALTAGRRLRAQKSRASRLTVHIGTSRFRDPWYGRTAEIPLGMPTESDIRLIRSAVEGLAMIYREGYDYVRGEVTLLELSSAETFQLSLFDRSDDRSAALSRVADRLNREAGRQLLRPALLLGEKEWRPRRDSHSGVRLEDLSNLPVLSS